MILLVAGTKIQYYYRLIKVRSLPFEYVLSRGASQTTVPIQSDAKDTDPRRFRNLPANQTNK